MRQQTRSNCISELTFPAAAATPLSMTGYQDGYAVAPGGRLKSLWCGFRGAVLVVVSAMLVVASTMALTGCISVATPDKPIVIELNINIKQEVIYRLAGDAGKTIDTNKEIF